jgi:hypothetical protein
MSAWDSNRAIGVLGRRHALGVWLTYRNLGTSTFVPNAIDRAPLRGKMPQWYVVNFALAARLNSEARVATTPGFSLVYLIGSSSLAAGFRMQVYDSEKKLRLGDPVNFQNEIGTAQEPFIVTKPYFFRTRSPLLVRVQNQDVSGATNNIQVVVVGYGSE